jgi:hypothetical protein
VWGTYSQIGTARWTYLIGLNLDAPLVVPMATLDPTAAGRSEEEGGAELGWVAYEGWHGVQRNDFVTISAGSSSTITLPQCPQISPLALGHALWVVAPVLPGGWVFLGETNKLVVASRRRLRSWEANATQLTLNLWATPTEKLRLAIMQPGQREGALQVVCVAGKGGLVRASQYFGDEDVTVQVVCALNGSSSDDLSQPEPECTC